MQQAALELGAQVGREHRARAVDQQGHLVTDEADVALRVRQYGQRRSVTAPPSKMRDAPEVSEVSPDATAASWSARSRGKPSDMARSSPSAETTTVWDTPGVLSTKLVINQFRFCAAWLIGLN